MARVTLIDPPGWQGAAAGQKPYPNIGIAFLVPPLVAAGHRVDVIDMNNEAVSEGEAIDRIIASNPDVTGFSVKTATMKSSRRLGALIRRSLPGTRILLGGPHATLCGEEIIREEWVDAVMAGEGEERVADVVDQLLGRRRPARVERAVERPGRPDQLFVRSPAVADLDSLAYPEYGVFSAEVQAGLATGYPLITSRGCVFGCTYCSVPTISGRCFRRRAPERIVAELDWARQRWGIASFELIDDSFNIDMEHSKRICRALVDADSGLRWTCPNGIRADLIDDELALLMAAAGCWLVMLGVEHADPSILKNANKGEKIADIERGIRCLQSAGIEVGGYFIIGLPGDSRAATRTSLEFAARLGITPHFNMLVPYPGTAAWTWVQQHGHLLANIEDGMHFSSDGALLPVFETDDFPASERLMTWEMVHTKLRRFDMIFPRTRRRWLDPWRKLALVLRYDRGNLVRSVVDTLRRALRRVRRTRPPRGDPAIGGVGGPASGRPLTEPAPPGSGPGQRATPRALRVLVVSNFFPPYVVGGYEIACSEVVDRLRARGHEVCVLTSRPDRRAAADAAPVYRRLEADLGWKRMSSWRYAARLLRKERRNRVELGRFLRTGEFDVVFFWNLRFLSVSLLEVARAEGLPFATYAFDDWMSTMPTDDTWLAWLRHRPRGFLNEALKRLLAALAPIPYRGADPSRRRWRNSIFGSEFLRQRALSAGTAGGDARVIHWGVDTEAFVPAEDPHRPLRNLLYCGQVVPVKGVHTAVQAFAILARDGRHDGLRLTIAGGSTRPDYVRELKASAESLDVGDRVRFVGPVPRKDVPALFRANDGLIFPSEWDEPFGIVVLEAMASGLAVVATATGGTAEILAPGVNAAVFSRGDAEDCARVLAGLIDDPALCARLRLQAREFVVAKHRFDTTVERIEARLLALVPSPAGNASRHQPT